MNFTLIDLIVIFIYLFIITLVGLYFSNTKNSKDFFLADKNLPWYFIMLSIIATETSSLTFLNVPGSGILEIYFDYLSQRVKVWNLGMQYMLRLIGF